MCPGHIAFIHISPKAGSALQVVDEVRAVAGHGLEGDRYFRKEGTFSKKGGPDREVTLIELEALEALERDYGLKLAPAECRRNLATRGVPLNHLVGRTFRVGDVMLQGIRLCEPCGHLEKLTLNGVQKGLAHRGGLRAQILTGGTIQKGAAVAVDC